MEDRNHPDYFRVAWQSALAAALCLGLPAGFSLLLHSDWSRFIIRLSLNRFWIFFRRMVFTVFTCWFLLPLYGVTCLVASADIAPGGGLRLRVRLAFSPAWFSPLANVNGILYEYRPVCPSI